MEANKIAPDTVNNGSSTTLGAGASQAHANIYDRTGMYLAIIAVVVSAMALGISLMMPQLNQARIDAMRGEFVALRGELQQAQEETRKAATEQRLLAQHVITLEAQLSARK